MMKSSQVQKRIMLIGVFLFWFSQYTYIPYLTPYMILTGIAATVTGSIVGIYGLVQTVLRIPLGILGDLHQRHKLIVCMGMLFSVLGSALLFFFSSTAAFYAARAMAGVAASSWASFTAMYSNRYKAASSNSVSTIMAVNNLGIFCSYIAGGLLRSRFSIRSLFLLSIIAALLGFVFALMLKPDEKKNGGAVTFRSMAAIFKEKRMWNYSLLCALRQFIIFATVQSFTTEAARQMGAGDWQLALLSAVFILFSVAGNFFNSTRFSTRFSGRTLVSLSFGLLGVYCAAFPFAGSIAPLFILQAIAGVGNSLMLPVLMENSIHHVPPENRATAISVFQAVYGVGMTLGPVAIGAIIEYAGYVAGFVAMGVAAALGVVWSEITFRLEEKKRRSKSDTSPEGL